MQVIMIASFYEKKYSDNPNAFFELQGVINYRQFLGSRGSVGNACIPLLEVNQFLK